MKKQLKKMVSRGSLVIGVLASLAFANHTQATVISSGFGSIPTAIPVTFGGSGIPNDTLDWMIIENSNGDQVTLGMSATQRFSSPVVTNDGKGNYTAQPGNSVGSSTASTWNFNFFIATTAASLDSALSGLRLAYDVDAGAGTDFGFIDFFAAGFGGIPVIQGSQNLSFSFLYSALTPGISPPTAGFNPDEIGIYDFRLEATYDSALSGTVTNGVGISVSVPEPTGLMLMGIGLLGLGLSNRKRLFK